MESKFKIGDIVVRVNEDWEETFVGSTYIVNMCYGNYLTLQGLGDYNYAEDNFVPYLDTLDTLEHIKSQLRKEIENVENRRYSFNSNKHRVV